jgi:hypothetical protein
MMAVLLAAFVFAAGVVDWVVSVHDRCGWFEWQRSMWVMGDG